ncbi:hypothetical protein KC675_05065 [Candidatus Dojkabacteria bacterium]|jgi:hypothetical protein|uniref:Uncharacterized protein n=1 Tax=Candidatus Dojkabacteria bacterium TaxID=2099670 RepID=A0A955L1D0_9BACT|nr:hypothetical protein [Candidatus Dojkabacteria bacterium]
MNLESGIIGPDIISTGKLVDYPHGSHVILEKKTWIVIDEFRCEHLPELDPPTLPYGLRKGFEILIDGKEKGGVKVSGRLNRPLEDRIVPLFFTGILSNDTLVQFQSEITFSQN